MSHSLPLSLWATPTLKKHWWLFSDSEVGALPQIYSSIPPPTPHEETERSRVGAERLGSNMLPRAAVCLGNSTKGEGKKRKRN